MRLSKPLIGLLILGACSAVQGTPILQLYLEGGTYNSSTDSWELMGGATSVRVWVIGNVAGEGGKGRIDGVRMAVAYDAPAAGAADPVITLTPSLTNGFNGFADSSLPDAPTFIGPVRTDGSLPVLSSGATLPSHGIYGTGVHWQEFGLGDFWRIDSQVADFIDQAPVVSSGSSTNGQINVYEVSMSGDAPIAFHFDVYDHYYANKGAKAVFAPFSHDGDGLISPPVPAPAALLLGVIGLGLVGWIRRMWAH